MPLDPQIPLMVQTPPPISPLATVGSLMQLRDTASQVALRDAQAQQAKQASQNLQAEAEQKQRDIKAYNQVGELLKDPNNQARVAKGDFSFIDAAGVSPLVADSVKQKLGQQLTTAQTLKTGQAGIYATQRAKLGAILEGLHPTDDAIAASQFNQAIPTLATEAPELAAHLSPLTPGPNFRQQLADLATVNGLHQSIFEHAAKLEEDQAKPAQTRAQTAESTAKAALDVAQTPGAVAESQRKTLITQAMQEALKDPTKGAAAIDAALPPAVDSAANSGYKAAWQSAMAAGNPEAAAKIVEAAAQHGASMSPATIAAAAKKAAAEAQATSPIKVAQAVAEAKATSPIKIAQAVQTQLELNKASGAALANVPPHLVVPATAAYNKAGQDLVGATNAATEMQDIINLARSGNVTAYAYAPTTGVLTINSGNGVKRVNMAEINQYAGQGSALDQIEGWFGKKLTGASLDNRVLNSMEQFHSTLAQNAERTHENAVSAINQAYGSKFAPIVLPNAPKPSGAGGKFVVTAPDGSTHPFDTQAQADAFKKLAHIP